MHDEIINKIIALRNRLDDLRTSRNDYNKYNYECFDSIRQDLEGMHGFIKMLKFIEENKDNFTSEGK